MGLTFRRPVSSAHRSSGKICTPGSSSTYVFGVSCYFRFAPLTWLILLQNIRIVSQYYTRITLTRLTSLLDLTQQQTEEILCRLVVSGTVWARIDRPAGIINFRKSRSAEDVMNDWSSDMQRLLGLVEKTWMGVNAAQAAQSRAVKAAS